MFTRGIQHFVRMARPWIMNSTLKGSIAVGHSNIALNHPWLFDQKRLFSQETKEYIDYILQQYSPSGVTRTKAEIIRELNSPKLSNERRKDLMAEILLLNQPFTSQELESILASFIKNKMYLRVVAFSEYCMDHHLMPSLNESCILWLLYSCSNRKEGEILQRIPKYSLHYLRGRYAFKAKYARALFTCGYYEKGKEYLDFFEKDRFRFSDCNNILLDGLYQGGFYSECISTFKRMKSIIANHPVNDDGKPVQLYELGYGAVLKAYCRLQDEQNMKAIVKEMATHNLVPREDDYFAMCDMYDHSTKWKALVDRVVSVCEKKGVAITDMQKQLVAARAKEESYGAGVIVISEYCKQFHSILDFHKEQSQLVLQCRELPESACRMRVLKLFRDIGMEYRWTESKNYEVVIRTKVGQDGIRRLLEEELVPSIPYRVDGYNVFIQIADILRWVDRKPFDFQVFLK